MLLVFLAVFPAHAAVPNTRTIAAALEKAAAKPPVGGVTVVLREVAQKRPATRSATQAAPGPPTWELRLIVAPSGDVTIERENLRLGAVSVERFAVADPSRKRPSWLRVVLAGPGGVARLARDLGVAQTTSLGRDGKAILWVWGAGPRDRKSSQLHIDRFSSRVVRVIDGAEDVSLRGVADTTTPWGRRWPRTVEFRQGKKTMRFDVVAIRAAPQSPRTPKSSTVTP